MVNKELLLKTLRYIEEHPEEWDQGHWMNPCRTKFCFAGHAALLSGVERPLAFPETDLLYDWYIDPRTKKSFTEPAWGSGRVYVAAYARSILGLTSDDAMNLFSMNSSLNYLRRTVDDIVSQADDEED